MDIVKFARQLAEEFHKGQTRKTLPPGQVRFKSGQVIPVKGIEEPEPYFNHPQRVTQILYQFFITESNKTKPAGKQYSTLQGPFYYADINHEVYLAAGYLHDVLEDCSNVSDNDLIKLFYKELGTTHCIGGIEDQMKLIVDWHKVVKAVVLLTKAKGQTFSYVNYLMGIKKDPVAKLVKLADLQDNMSDLERGCSLYQKYELTKFVLQHPYESEANRK